MLRSARKYLEKDFVVIYQMGKVGSTTLEKAIAPSVNVHTLYSNHPCSYNHSVSFLGLWGWVRENVTQLIKRCLLRYRKEVKVICVVRDPLKRNASMFFQDLPFWYTYACKFGRLKLGKLEGNAVLLDIFSNHFSHEYPYEWFDKEVKRFTGIDVIKENENEEGFDYSLHHKGRYKVLVLKAENMNREGYLEVVESFLGKDLDLNNSNVGGDKWYGCIYNEIKGDLEKIGERKQRRIGKSKDFLSAFGYQVPGDK